MSWVTDEEMIQDASRVVGETLPYAFVSSSTDLQVKAIEALVEMFSRLIEHKSQAQLGKRDHSANLAYALQRFVRGTADYLRMWVHIKQDQMIDAWDSLVDARRDFE